MATAKTGKKSGLGKGLDALIPEKKSTAKTVTAEPSKEGVMLSIDKVEPNREQPRKNFDEDALAELSDSIKNYGIIEPIVVVDKKDYYQIVSGERRWRATQKAGIATIPAYVRTLDDASIMTMALVENIQREDLNSLEIALAYQHLIDKYDLTQEKLSDRVGKKRATIANYLRLLKLPAPVQVALQNHQIDTGHARTLLALDDPKDQLKVFHQIQEKGYSVRQVEELIKSMNDERNAIDESETPAAKPAASLPQEYESIRSEMTQKIGTDVKIVCSRNGKGKVSFSFKDIDELRRIVSLLNN